MRSKLQPECYVNIAERLILSNFEGLFLLFRKDVEPQTALNRYVLYVIQYIQRAPGFLVVLYSRSRIILLFLCTRYTLFNEPVFYDYYVIVYNVVCVTGV